MRPARLLERLLILESCHIDFVMRRAEVGRELPLDHRVEAAHGTNVIGVTSRSNFPAMYRWKSQI
jgi:hypothetical protein